MRPVLILSLALTFALGLQPTAPASQQLFGVQTLWPLTTGPQEWRVSAAPDAYLAMAVVDSGFVSGYQVAATSSPAVSRLADELRDGTLDQLTFSFAGGSFSQPESFFGTTGSGPPVHGNNIPFAVDLANLRIDYFELFGSKSAGGDQYLVAWSVFGGIPEPTSLVLAAIGFIYLSGKRFSGGPRRNVLPKR